MTDAVPVRCSILRGGTSKAVFFLANDLPAERPAIEPLLLNIFGSPAATRDRLELDDGRSSEVSIVDAANPVVFVTSESLGLTSGSWRGRWPTRRRPASRSRRAPST